MCDCISVIVPIFNTAEYLPRCIDSILRQTYSNLEIILVDDGSTDSSPTLCNEYEARDTRIKVIHKTNGGLSSARNAGLEIASGQYIGFVDSDDYVSPMMYEKLHEAIADKNRKIACAIYCRVDSNNITSPSCVPHLTKGTLEKEAYFGELLMHLGDVSVCTKLFPADMLQGYRFDEKKLNEDLLFMVSLMPAFDAIEYTDEVGYFYFVRENSISSSYGKSVRDMVENSLVVKKIVYSDYPSLQDQADRFALIQHMGYLLLVPEVEAVRENNLYSEALSYLRRNIFHNLLNPWISCKQKILIVGLAYIPAFVRKVNRMKHSRK